MTSTAGLTEHPLVAALEPPSHLQQWVHQTVRATALLGVTAKVKWKNPAASLSNRPNDRPIWDELPHQGKHALLRFNLKARAKIRYVGDVATGSGLAIMTVRELTARHRWSSAETTAYEEIAGIIMDAVCSGVEGLLLRPVGWTRYDARHLGMMPVHIAPGQFFVISEFEEGPDGLRLTGHEIGQRIGELVHGYSDEANEQTDTSIQLDLGTEIDVQWWHQRQTDIWTERPEGRGREYAEVCVPVRATPLPKRTQSRTGRRNIFWTDVTIEGVAGLESRELIEESYRRSVRRYQAVLLEGELSPIGTRRSCQDCHRISGARECNECGEWHHHRCRQCPVDYTTRKPRTGVQFSSRRGGGAISEETNTVQITMSDAIDDFKHGVCSPLRKAFGSGGHSIRTEVSKGNERRARDDCAAGT